MEKGEEVVVDQAGVEVKTEVVGSEQVVEMPAADQEGGGTGEPVRNVSAIWSLVKIVLLSAVFTVFLAGVAMVVRGG